MAEPIAVIEIEVLDDGSFTVSKESGSQEAAESGSEGAEPNEVKAASLDEALSIARSMAGSVSPVAPAEEPATPVKAIPAKQAGIGINRSKPNALTMR